MEPAHDAAPAHRECVTNGVVVEAAREDGPHHDVRHGVVDVTADCMERPREGTLGCLAVMTETADRERLSAGGGQLACCCRLCDRGKRQCRLGAVAKLSV